MPSITSTSQRPGSSNARNSNNITGPSNPNNAIRRSLSKTALPPALAASKIQSYTDTITYPHALTQAALAALPTVSTASGAVNGLLGPGAGGAGAVTASVGGGGSGMGVGGFGAPGTPSGAAGAGTGAAAGLGVASSSPASNIRCIAWSPLGNLIATADPKVLRVWNPEKPGVRFSTELKIPPSSVSHAASTNAAGGGGGTASGSSIGGGGSSTLPSRLPPTTSSSSSSSTYASHQQSQHLTGTERVAWNPTREAELASVGSDGVLRFWDVRAKQQLVGEVKLGGEGFSLAWRPPPGSSILNHTNASAGLATTTTTTTTGGGVGVGGEELVVGRRDDTLLHISRRNLSIVTSQAQTVQTNQIGFSNSSHELLLTTADSTIKILDFPSLQLLHTINAHTSSCYTVTACPRGRYLATGGSDALVTLWDTTDFSCRHSLSECVGPIRSVSFSFDGSFIAAGSDEGHGLMVAHVESGEYIFTHPTTHPIPCVAWHPTRYWIAYAGEPQGLRIIGASGGPL